MLLLCASISTEFEDFYTLWRREVYEVVHRAHKLVQGFVCGVGVCGAGVCGSGVNRLCALPGCSADHVVLYVQLWIFCWCREPTNKAESF